MATASEVLLVTLMYWLVMGGMWRDAQRLRQHHQPGGRQMPEPPARRRGLALAARHHRDGAADDLRDEAAGVERQANTSAANSGDSESPPLKLKPRFCGRSGVTLPRPSAMASAKARRHRGKGKGDAHARARPPSDPRPRQPGENGRHQREAEEREAPSPRSTGRNPESAIGERKARRGLSTLAPATAARTGSARTTRRPAGAAARCASARPTCRRARQQRVGRQTREAHENTEHGGEHDAGESGLDRVQEADEQGLGVGVGAPRRTAAGSRSGRSSRDRRGSRSRWRCCGRGAPRAPAGTPAPAGRRGRAR